MALAGCQECPLVPGASAAECAQLASMHLPAQLTPSAGNALADDLDAARLGHAMFFDARLSSDQNVRCASCHIPERFFADGKPTSKGLAQVTRNSPSIYNAAWKHWQMWAGMQYVMFKSGPVASNIVEAGAFWWSDRGEATPDLQFHFLAGAGVEEGVGTVPGGNGATCNSYQVRPRSRGAVTLRSADPFAAPVIDPNSFAEPYDLERHIDAIKITQEVGHSRSMKRYVTSEHFPGPACKTKKDYEDMARANARSSYHPVGTCKMGRDEMAVVDPLMRVRGLDGLRVCDSSTMPRVVSSNTNAPTIAMAEKAADLIRGNR